MERYLFLVFDVQGEGLDYNLIETDFEAWSDNFDQLVEMNDDNYANMFVLKVNDNLPEFFEQLARDLKNPEKYENADKEVVE